jgi:hypothetical protein
MSISSEVSEELEGTYKKDADLCKVYILCYVPDFEKNDISLFSHIRF